MNVDFDAQQALNFLVQFGVLIGLIAGAIVWLKRWIRRTVSEPIKEQVAPNGGDNQDTTRHIIESIQKGQVEIIERLDTADINADRNYALAVAAQTLAQHVSDRFDKFLKDGGQRGGRSDQD